MPTRSITAVPLGGHTDLLFSHAVYWTGGRAPNQPLVDNDPKYGKVYHIGSADDLMEMARREDVLINMPHPRTKGSTGYPDSVKDLPFFNDPHYQGIGFRWGMGLDRSEERLCEYPLSAAIDDMNNWVADKPSRRSTSCRFQKSGISSPATRSTPARRSPTSSSPRCRSPTIEPGHSGADARRLVRHVGRSADPDLRRHRHGQPAHDRRGRRMDVPAELRRGRSGATARSQIGK